MTLADDPGRVAGARVTGKIARCLVDEDVGAAGAQRGGGRHAIDDHGAGGQRAQPGDKPEQRVSDEHGEEHGGHPVLLSGTLLPALLVLKIGKTLENATDYSLQNTLRQALFLPTTREAKYKAKAAIDTFFMRTGDVLQAGVVGIRTRAPSGA